MKQRGPPPWDLTASVIVAASALVLFLFPSEQLASFVEPYLFVLVLLLPGYLLSITLFPRRYDLAGKGRLVVCVGADILILLLLCIGLYFSPWGLNLSSLAASAAIVALVLAVIAHFSRSALPRWNRFVPFISGSGRKHPLRNKEAGSSGRMVAVILVLIAAGVLSTLAYTTMNAGDMGENGEAHFTEFYIQGEKGEDRPIPVAAGSTASAVVGIINRELRVVNYTLRLAQNGSTLSQKEISLDHNQSWEGAVDYVLKDPGSLQRLDFLLYKEGNFSAPYTEDHLWLNVSAANVASENSSESSEDGTITLQQTKKVVVLSAGEDTSSDKKKHSDSGEATSQVASQSASKSASKSKGKDEPEQFPLQDMESDPAKNDGQTAVRTDRQTDRQNNDALQTSSENASRETAASSSSRKVGDSSEVSASTSDVSESDIAESEIPESKEKLVATAVALETNDPDTDNHVTGADEIDTPSHIPSQIPSYIPAPSNPEKDNQKLDVQKKDNTGNDNLAAANQEKDTSTVDSSAAGNPDVDNSDVDNSKAGDSSSASDVSSSPVESSDVKAPSEDGPKSETSQTDQAATKQGGDNKSDANDASSAGGEQSVSQEEDASETSEMDNEIDSWVSTRGFSKSDQSQAFKSRNIRYVKKGDSGESAVLGSQSKTPVRLGR